MNENKQQEKGPESKPIMGGAINQTTKDANPGQPYLNHGTPSLVGMDNPDDSQLGTAKQHPTK